jgi:hypothetical protein
LDRERLNALPEELAIHPRQAIVCSIKDVKPPKGKSWPKKGSDSTFEIIFVCCKSYTINVKSVHDNGRLEVVMTRDDGKNIADLLRMHGYAAPLQIDGMCKATSTFVLYFSLI